MFGTDELCTYVSYSQVQSAEQQNNRTSVGLSFSITPRSCVSSALLPGLFLFDMARCSVHRLGLAECGGQRSLDPPAPRSIDSFKHITTTAFASLSCRTCAAAENNMKVNSINGFAGQFRSPAGQFRSPAHRCITFDYHRVLYQ